MAGTYLVIPVSFLENVYALDRSAYVTLRYLDPYHVKIILYFRGVTEAYNYIVTRTVLTYNQQLELDAALNSALDYLYAEMKYKLGES